MVKATGHAVDPEVQIPVQPLLSYVILVEHLTWSLCFLICPVALIDLPSGCGVALLTD